MDGVAAASGRAIQWLADFTAVEKFDFAAIEAPVPERALHGETNAWSTAIKFALIGAIGGALRLRRVPIGFRHIASVRAFFISKGNAPGDQAKRAARAVCRLLEWDAKNDDEGDAAALWAFECSKRAPLLAPRVDPISLGCVPYEFFGKAARKSARA